MTSSATAMVTNKHVCRLMRLQDQIWVQLSTKSHAIISDASISIRDSISLQCDLPLVAIKKMQFLKQSSLVCIYTGSTQLALRFDDDLMLNNFRLELIAKRVPNINITSETLASNIEIPNVQQASTQEYILQLLFSESFSNFVEDIETLLESFQEHLLP